MQYILLISFYLFIHYSVQMLQQIVGLWFTVNFLNNTVFTGKLNKGKETKKIFLLH
jgi:hypothetical protein